MAGFWEAGTVRLEGQNYYCNHHNRQQQQHQHLFVKNTLLRYKCETKNSKFGTVVIIVLAVPVNPNFVCLDPQVNIPSSFISWVCVYIYFNQQPKWVCTCIVALSSAQKHWGSVQYSYIHVLGHSPVLRYIRVPYSAEIHWGSVQSLCKLGRCPVLRWTGEVSSVQILQVTVQYSDTMRRCPFFGYAGALSTLQLHWGTVECSDTLGHFPMLRHTWALFSAQIQQVTVQCLDRLGHFTVFKYANSQSSVQIT